MPNVQQSEDTSLRPVADMSARRRKEIAREMAENIKRRGQKLLCRLVKHPTSCWLTNGYGHSRGRNHTQHAVTSRLYELLLDRAAGLEPEEAAERLMLVRAEVDAVVTQLLDRVVGLGESEVDVQTALELEAREDAEQDVAKIEALADRVLTEAEAKRIEERTTSEIARKRQLIRAINRARLDGDLPSGEVA